jgi:hypothetical protein
MDQVGVLVPAGPTPAAGEDVSCLAGCLMSCILSCAASNDLFAERSFAMLHTGMAANMSALEQLKVFLNEDNLMPTIKVEGKESVDELTKRFHDLCRGVAVVLLRANTSSPDEAGLRALTDQQMAQRLSPRHLATVIRGERHKWLKPRAVLYLEQLATLAIDVMLHTYVFRLAKLQMRYAVKRPQYECLRATADSSSCAVGPKPRLGRLKRSSQFVPLPSASWLFDTKNARKDRRITRKGTG